MFDLEIVFLFICPRRIDTAPSTRVPRPAAVSAAEDGEAVREDGAAAVVRHVLRQEQVEAGVLVQHTEEPHRRTVPFPEHLGPALVRRTGRGANQAARIRAHPARHRLGQRQHKQSKRDTISGLLRLRLRLNGSFSDSRTAMSPATERIFPSWPENRGR